MEQSCHDDNKQPIIDPNTLKVYLMPKDRNSRLHVRALPDKKLRQTSLLLDEKLLSKSRTVNHLLRYLSFRWNVHRHRISLTLVMCPSDFAKYKDQFSEDKSDEAEEDEQMVIKYPCPFSIQDLYSLQ